MGRVGSPNIPNYRRVDYKLPTYSGTRTRGTSFGAITSMTVRSRGANAAKGMSDKDIEAKYGQNKWAVANSAVNMFGATTSSVNSINNLNNINVSELGEAATGTKTSSEVLSDIKNANNYAKLSAGKAELEAGKDTLTNAYNEDCSTYIDSNTQATLSELGIEIPTLQPISGEYEDYEKDMKSFDDGQNKCQGVHDEANQKLPEITEKKCVAKSKVTSLEAACDNLKAQINATKDPEAKAQLKAQLEQKKAELREAKEELAKYEQQEQALNDAMAQTEEKIDEIEKNKEDLTNYHEAESQVVDKTYEIAQNDDRKLNAQINKLKEKKREIENAVKDISTSTTDASDDIRNERIEGLQAEYEKIALETTDVFVDLGNLIKDNDNDKNVRNSSLHVYTIKHYDEAQKMLTEDQTE